jgi:Xaa-Pro aminopeptidase
MRAGTGIPEDELRSRRARLLEHVRGERLRGYVLFDAQYIRYLTGFGFLSTERPVAVAQSVDGEPVAFVPEFEVDRVRAEADFGGFRHSDTVAVTPDGIDILTDYPRDIESLTIEA